MSSSKSSTTLGFLTFAASSELEEKESFRGVDEVRFGRTILGDGPGLNWLECTRSKSSLSLLLLLRLTGTEFFLGLLAFGGSVSVFSCGGGDGGKGLIARGECLLSDRSKDPMILRLIFDSFSATLISPLSRFPASFFLRHPEKKSPETESGMD